MVAPILRGLVAVLLSVTFTEAGTVEKGQAQGAVVRLIRAVLAVRKHSHAVTATSVGEIEPLVRRRSEEHTSELQSQSNLVCRLLLEKKKKKQCTTHTIMDEEKQQYQR